MDWLEALNEEECEEKAEINYCEALRVFCPGVGHKVQFGMYGGVTECRRKGRK